MRIIFLNRYYAPDHSATSQMLTDLAVALAHDGSEVHVVTSRLRYDDPGAALPSRESLGGVTVHRVRTTGLGRGNLAGRMLDYSSFYVAASAKLWTLVRRGDVVVAKTDPPLISVPVGWVARWRGAKYVNWLQDLFPEVAAALGVALASGFSGGLMRRLRDGSLRHAASNVVLGRLMQQRVEMRGVDALKVAVIPNWADGNAVRPVAPDGNRLRAEWGLRDKFVAVYSGNMGRAHEFQTILGAAAALRERTDVMFVFIGDGAQKARIAQAAAELGLENLIFKPYQPRELLSQSLGTGDVHLATLQPALEGLIVPSKFYGILAAGRPTIFIGDPDGEIGTIVREDECGICASPGDVDALVAGILRLRNDPPLCAGLGRNARRIFEARYDLPIAVDKWRQLLRNVADLKNV